MKKLDSYSPLGYSCAGEVIEVGECVNEFKVGDKVACAGAGYANHAEIVAIPVNLCVKLNKNVNMRDAAYNTLGAISMQAVRQADMRLGETVLLLAWAFRSNHFFNFESFRCKCNWNRYF